MSKFKVRAYVDGNKLLFKVNGENGGVECPIGVREEAKDEAAFLNSLLDKREGVFFITASHEVIFREGSFSLCAKFPTGKGMKITYSRA